MAMLQANALSPLPATPALPGTWKLAPGRAITLEPREAGVLKVAHGQLWATFDGPHRGRSNESGDHFYGVGERVRLVPGQRMVLEAWNHGAPAYFSWDPLPQSEVLPRVSFASVVQPLADLRVAITLGAGAVSRLGAGLVQVAWSVLRGPRVTVEERACGRHGALG